MILLAVKRASQGPSFGPWLPEPPQRACASWCQGGLWRSNQDGHLTSTVGHVFPGSEASDGVYGGQDRELDSEGRAGLVRLAEAGGNSRNRRKGRKPRGC